MVALKDHFRKYLKTFSFVKSLWYQKDVKTVALPLPLVSSASPSQWRKRFSKLYEKWAAIHLSGLKYCTCPCVLDLSCTTFKQHSKHIQQSVIRNMYVFSFYATWLHHFILTDILWYTVSTTHTIGECAVYAYTQSMVTQWVWRHISWGNCGS